jgi:ribose transport system substrate-binding protein
MNSRFMKSGTIATVVAIAGLVLGGCSGGKPVTASGQGADKGGQVTIGFSVSTMQNPYFVSMAAGVQEKAKALGVKVLTGDAGDDAAKQANDIQNFISQHVSAVILNPTDGDAVGSSVKALNDAGIPVITVDRTSNSGAVKSQIGTDNVTAGATTAKTLFDDMGGKGNVLVLEGVPGASPTRDRGTGFQQTLKSYPGIKIVGSQTANFQRDQGLTVAQNLLQAHRDATAILSMNDEMALGAVEALRSSGKLGHVKIIGIDGGADAIKAVEAGTMVATIAQQPKKMGESSVETAVKVAKGESVPKTQPVDIIVVTKANAASFKP